MATVDVPGLPQVQQKDRLLPGAHPDKALTSTFNAVDGGNDSFYFLSTMNSQSPEQLETLK